MFRSFPSILPFFFFNDTPPTEIYPLPLHDALPISDANLLLGRLGADSPLAGGVELDREAAARAIGDVARRLDLDPVACAEGILRVAVAEMVRALRVVTVTRGVDPRGCALLAFCGAGPPRAAHRADELGGDTIP